MRPPRSQNDPSFSLVGGVTLGLVVERQCPFDDFGVGNVEGLSLLAHPVKGVLRQPDGQGWIFGGHLLDLHRCFDHCTDCLLCIELGSILA